MYVKTAGLGSIRRGLGELNCPGDAGCPGNVQPVDTLNPCDTTSRMFDANVCNNMYAPKAGTPGTLTAWLNANGTMLAVGAGVSLLMLMLARGR